MFKIFAPVLAILFAVTAQAAVEQTDISNCEVEANEEICQHNNAAEKPRVEIKAPKMPKTAYESEGGGLHLPELPFRFHANHNTVLK